MLKPFPTQTPTTTKKKKNTNKTKSISRYFPVLNEPKTKVDQTNEKYPTFKMAPPLVCQTPVQ